jgi:hypothetical protein
MPPPPPPQINPLIGPTAPTGIPSYGTQFQVLTSAAGVTPETFITIAGVGDITGPNPQIAEVETTSHSTGTPVRTFIPSLADPGQVQFKLYWQPTDPTQNPSSSYSLEYLFWNRIVTKFRIVNTDPAHRTREAFGFIKQISETYTVAGLCERTVIVRVSGAFQDVTPAISLTPASATGVLAAGGPATFSVATGGNQTSWTATPDAAWITVTAPTGPTTGDQTVNYTVAVNGVGQPARTAHINIVALGLQFTISQVAG